MRPVRSLFIYLLVVFIGGALLAPWLYFLAQNMASHFPAVEKLASSPFHRFVNRSLLILGVLGLWPLFRGLQIKSWKDVGLASWKGNGGQLGRGFGIGFFSLAIVAGASIFTGARAFNVDHTGADYVRHLINAVLAAVIVAILEEVIFRGAVFGAMCRAISWKAALILSSAIYALVHFFSRPEPPSEITWITGLIVLGKMLRGFVDFQMLVPAFINLLLAGMILALAFRITGNLYYSIGLHAGWIFWLKSFGFLTHATRESWFWGTSKLIDGWAAGIVLLILFVFWLPWKSHAKVEKESQ